MGNLQTSKSRFIMDTNILIRFYITILMILIVTVGCSQQYPMTPNSPYTVRWYQVSQDPSMTGNSEDSSCFTGSIKTTFYRCSYWILGKRYLWYFLSKRKCWNW